jgi:hypothetical protein
MPENTTSSATSHPELLQAHRSAFNQQRTLLRAQALLFGDLFALARHTLTQALVAPGLTDSAFRGSQLQNFWFGVDGLHVVATLGAGLAHRPIGDVVVEQELHPRPACPKNRTLAARH